MVARRWLKIGGGIAVGVTTISLFFQLLITLYGFQIIDLTGNIICDGTFENPCISEFNVRNPNPYNVDIYNKYQVKLEFSPEIKDYALFVKDGRCSATGACACDMLNGNKLGFKGWRCVDFTNKTKPRKDKVYVFRFPAYTTKNFRLAGLKNNPNDNIKWSFGVENKELDPYWLGNDIGGFISYKSYYTLTLTKFNGLEKWLVQDKEWYVDNDLIIFNETYNYTKKNLHIDLVINTTVYNWMKNAYQNPTMDKCLKAEPYVQEDYPNFDCSNSEHRDLLLSKLENIATKGMKLIQGGINKGYINRTGNEIDITIPYSSLVSGDIIKIGESSVHYTISTFSISESIDTNITQENNFTHLDISEESPYDSLVLYMPFDVENKSDGIMYDWSSSGNDGTINGNPVWNSTGKYGGAYEFDGDGDWVEVADSDGLSFGNSTDDVPFTISSWVYIKDSDKFRILSKYDYSDNFEWSLYLDGSSDLNFKLYDNALADSIGKEETDISGYENQWIHIVASYDGSGSCDGINLTLNNEDVGSDAISGSYVTMHNTNQDVYIGYRNHDVSYSNGSIDEVMIFNTSLTAQQIADIYNNQSARFKTNGTQELKQFNMSVDYNWLRVTEDDESLMGSDLLKRLGF